MKQYLFHPEALAEYEAAATWYQSRSVDAAHEFVTAIEYGIRTIRELPKAWPAWSGGNDVRVRFLNAIRYSIMYLDEPEVIVIVAITHQRRNPSYWSGRL